MLTVTQNGQLQGRTAWKALESSGRGNGRKTCGPGQEGHPLVSTLCGGQRGGQGCHGVRPDKQEHGLELLILRMSVVAPRPRFALLRGTEDTAGSRDRSCLRGDVPRGASGMDPTRTAAATRDAVSRLDAEGCFTRAVKASGTNSFQPR